MNNRKSAAMIVILLAVPFVMAQKEGGIMPDSPLYGLDVAIDEIRYLMADADGQARIGLEIADERLVEVRQMILENKIDASLRAEDEHERALAKIKRSIASAKNIPDIDRSIRLHEQSINDVKNSLRIVITAGNITGNLSEIRQRLVSKLLDALEQEVGDVKVKISEKKNDMEIKARDPSQGKKDREKEHEKDDDDDDKDEVRGPHFNFSMNNTAKNYTKHDDDEDDEDERDDDHNKKADALARLTDARLLVSKLRSALGLAPNEKASKFLDQAEKHLAKAEDAFREGKYGEAFGQATSASSHARSGLALINPIVQQAVYSSIRGIFFHDANGNGLKENESGLEGWTVVLTGPVNRTAVTNASGQYIFANLTNGTYKVSQITRPGWVQSSGNYTINVLPNNSYSADFGDFMPAHVTGSVFEDTNGNGIRDGNESVLNTTVSAGGKTVATNGSFELTLNPGTYTLVANKTGIVTTNMTVTLLSGQNVTRDIGLFNPGTIMGMSFNDTNNNTLLDGNETGIPSLVIRLSGAKNATAVTDINGTYKFDLLGPGFYVVEQLATNTTLPAYNFTMTSGTVFTANFANIG